ncbi:MAG: DUF3810 domain-containing protein [Clostridia bacterium]|nr:DUF3810 domain-containing protein [Clostridia bacterium]
MNKRINADYRTFFKVSILLFAYSIIVLVICIFSRQFSEMYCRTFSAGMRNILSAITGIFNFSVAEMLLFVLPIGFVVFEIYLTVRKRFSFKKMFVTLLTAVFIAFFLFVNTFGVCYFRKPVEENMGFDIKEFSDSELMDSALFIKQRLENFLDGTVFLEDGSSKNPYNWSELNSKLIKGFDRLKKDYPFISYISSPAKKIYMSPVMTYTHISGIFMPFTAEANVNTNYPEYVVAFSTAHEMAHQRGVAGEDEANFIAFLACLSSGDSYLSYSALLSMYDYYLDEAYKTDKEMYIELLSVTDKRVLGEMYAYSVFFDKYRDSAASRVADVVNDSYIKTMGDKVGVESYGRVVELCTSYLIEKEALPY